MASKRNKYGAVKTTVDGIKFDSKLEASRYCELRTMQAIGVISDLKMQETFIVIPKQQGERATKYIADFTYMENGKLVVEDVKGGRATATTVYRIKKKLMLLVHGIKLRETH